MYIRRKDYKYILFMPLALILSLMVLIYIYSGNDNTAADPAYTGWEIKVNDYKTVRLTWNDPFFCGEWEVPIREYITDHYCILSSGREILPNSWTNSPDSLAYEEFMDEVVDTMRVIAERRGYISYYNKRW